MKKSMLNKKGKGFFANFVAMTAMVVVVAATPAFAANAGVNQITNGLQNVVSLVQTAVTYAGVLACLLALVQLARSIPAHESTQITGAALGLVAGLVLALNRPLLALLGITV